MVMMIVAVVFFIFGKCVVGIVLLPMPVGVPMVCQIYTKKRKPSVGFLPFCEKKAALAIMARAALLLPWCHGFIFSTPVIISR